MSAVAAEKELPVLCVDLDGTLIKTDLLFESLVRLIKRNPFHLFSAAIWLTRGKAYLKRRIAEQVSINPALLPYREDVLAFLREEHARGRKLVLATAADQRYADEIARHTGLFVESLGSDGKTNFSRERKLAGLASRYGEFAYLGDSPDDLVVWQGARDALVAGNNGAVLHKLKTFKTPSRIFPAPRIAFGEVAALLRVHQWAKNLIVFIPLVAAHKFFQPEVFAKSALAFLAFSLLASAVYIINDLMDLDADRSHPTKRHRPIAAGRVSIPAAASVIPVLIVGCALCVLGTNPSFAGVLLGYLALSTLYTFHLKRMMVLDVLCLAMLYTIRLIGGHVATSVVFSPWLLTFSMFVFFSLALVKRFSELSGLRASAVVSAVQAEVRGRGYLSTDVEVIGMLGVGSGLVSVMVMALYVSSDAVQKLYRQPYILLLLCPLLLYWVCRLWMLAHRGQLDEDPVFFALHDRASYLIGICSVVVLLLAACV